MNKNIEFFIIAFGFISAVFLCSFFKIGITFSIFLLFISVILFLFRKLYVLDIGNKQNIFLIIIFLTSISVGIVRYEIKDSYILDVNLESNISNKVTVSGIISDEPKRTEKQDILIVNFQNLIDTDSELGVSGKGIVSTDLYPEFKYGDLVKINGKITKPENFSNSVSGSLQTKEFDYISYLAKDNIFYKIDFAKVELVSSGHGNFIKSFLFHIKNSFTKNIEKTITTPESSLLSGILLGAKSSLDENTEDNFRKSGLSHIIALSGYNITIIADGIMKVLSFLPRNFGFFGGVLGIILFVLMSGATSTAVRAAVMSLIVILASVTKRNYQAGRALLIAGVLMVFVNPKILVFDTSFQLSFLATIAIIYVAPIFKTKLIFITERFGLRDIVASTISAQILVLPLILYKMGMLSLVALPANILVLVFIPATMLFSAVTGILGFIWLPISLPFAWISWILLAYIIKVSDFFSSLPFSSVSISWFSSGIMAISYIIIAICIIIENRKIKNDI